jgi:hypothetical protein
MELQNFNSRNNTLPIARFSKACDEIATIQDYNISRLEGKFKALKADIILSDAIERNSTMSLDEFINNTCTGGSTKQRNALARKLSIKDGLALDSTEALINRAKDKAVAMQIYDKCVADNIILLAESFGCEFKGDLLDVADVLRNSYKYFSLLDWNLFFNYCKDGRYKTEYQNISARGINLEFLNEWIKQYDGERDEAIAVSNNDFKNYLAALPADVTSSFLEKQRINAEKTAKLDAIRERWHKNKPSLKDEISVFSRVCSLNRKDVLEYLRAKYNPNFGDEAKFVEAAFKSLRYNTFKLKGFDLVLDFIQAYEKDGRKVEDIQGQLAKISEMCDIAWLKYRDGAIEFAEVSKEPFFVSNKKEFILEYGIKFIIQQGGENPIKLT